MKSIDDIKAITVDEHTYEAARAGMRPGQLIIERLFLVIYNANTLTLTELEADRLDATERTTLSTLLQKAQIGPPVRPRPTHGRVIRAFICTPPGPFCRADKCAA